MGQVAVTMEAPPFDGRYNDGTGPTGSSTAQGDVEKVTVRVVHAGFGDITLLEVLHKDGEFSHMCTMQLLCRHDTRLTMHADVALLTR